MAKLILDKWQGSKYVYVNKCDITHIQDEITLKLIQEYKCRIKSPRKPVLNILHTKDLMYGFNIYNEVNGIIVDVSNKTNWIIRNNVLFLRLTKTSLNKEILLMLVNTDKLEEIKEEQIYDLIKDVLLNLDYEVEW